MKKLVALLLLVSVVLPVMAFGATAASYPIGVSTFSVISAGRGLSISAVDGQTVVFDSTVSTGNSMWSAARLTANDDLTDGFRINITNIQWDEDTDNCIGIVTTNHATNVSAADATNSNSASNVTLVVKKDGTVDFTANGYSQNHMYASNWSPVTASAKISANATSLVYACIPDANDSTVYRFYVNDVLVYEYDTDTAPSHAKGIFADLTRKVNFGFQVFNGTRVNVSNGAMGFGSNATGTLSYTVDSVMSTGACAHEGGEATCASPAICDICGEPYGDVSDVHTGATEVRGETAVYTGDTYCLGCEKVIAYGEEKAVIPGGDTDVNGSYEGKDSETVFAANITWGAFDYVYSVANNTWYTEDGNTIDGADGHSKIVVENRSNVALDVSFSYAAENSYAATSGDFYAGSSKLESSQQIASAVGSDEGVGPTIEVLFVPAGSIDVSVDELVQIGSITVTLNPVE